MYHFFNFLYLSLLFSNILFSLRICNGAKYLLKFHILFGVFTAVLHELEKNYVSYFPEDVISAVFRISLWASVAVGSTISWILTARCVGGNWVYPYAVLITWGFYTGVMRVVEAIILFIHYIH
jgi:hypothetical protein